MSKFSEPATEAGRKLKERMGGAQTEAGRRRKEEFAKRHARKIQDKIDKLLEGVMTESKKVKLKKLRKERTKAEAAILKAVRGEGR